MSAIWRDDGQGWRLEAPEGFKDEAALHDLVEQAPQLLPLAGNPVITVLGREVRLGTGYADLIAVESTGRIVVVEVKLAANGEARRAIVSQILTYAAHLYRLERGQLETGVLSTHLTKRGFDAASDAVAANYQEGIFSRSEFEAGLDESLATGRFRLVIVLDEAPAELVTLIGYLEAVTESLTIDLVTVSKYDIAGSAILVPQRVDPGRDAEMVRPAPVGTPDDTYLAEGAGDFIASIDKAPLNQQALLRRLAGWAVELEEEGLVKLATFHGKENRRLTLLPRLKADNVGLVTIWNDTSSAYLQFWRSVFVRRAPRALTAVDACLHPLEVGQGNVTASVSDALLAALTDAYREAASGVISGAE